jgi:hypothetical protein
MKLYFVGCNKKIMDQHQLRSSNWVGRKDKDGFIYLAWMKNQGSFKRLSIRVINYD